MIYQVFAIRDVHTGFLTPTVDVNEASAMRNFEHAVLRNEDSLFFSHPEDYALFFLGTYDTDTGLIKAMSTPEQMITAQQVIDSALSKRRLNRDGENGVS